jgi:hypothetical protein
VVPLVVLPLYLLVPGLKERPWTVLRIGDVILAVIGYSTFCNGSPTIAEYDRRIEQIATEAHPEIALLKQLKGVGTLIALTMC